MEQGALLTVVLAGLGGLVWLIRLEGRVNTTRELHDSLKADVTYIRQRIDNALNGHDER